MKKIVFGLLLIGATTGAWAQPPAGDAKPGDFYGEKVNPEGALALVDVVSKVMGGSDFADVKIVATVKDVCAKKGCWLKLELPQGEEVMVKMKDYGFFLPTSVAELKHYAEDAKKSQAEIDAIKEPLKEVRITAKGIVIAQ